MAIVFGALTVGLDLLAKQVVWSRPAWAYELHIITDGKPFSQTSSNYRAPPLYPCSSLPRCSGVSDFGDELLESLKNKLPSVPASTTVVFVPFYSSH
jgi:hypothetical protein